MYSGCSSFVTIKENGISNFSLKYFTGAVIDGFEYLTSTENQGFSSRVTTKSTSRFSLSLK